MTQKAMRICTVLCGVGLMLASQAAADVRVTMSYTTHREYQAINASGGSTFRASPYDPAVPVRMLGVVVAVNYLDTTAVQGDVSSLPYDMLNMGGEWEIFIQAIDPTDPGKYDWDDGDFGGTKLWMGQLYGNHPLNGDTAYNYSSDDWSAELARLETAGGTLPDGQVLQLGDLIEVHANTGLFYNGTMNVNEGHDNDWEQGVPTDGSGAHDFTIEIVERGYGLPEASVVGIDEINTFDATRATGGEHYQGTRIELEQVRFVETGQSLLDGWTADSEKLLHVEDIDGNSLALWLGHDDNFDLLQTMPTGWFDLTGVLNQSGLTDGYYLVVADASQFAVAIPEPVTATLAGLLGLAFCGMCRKSRRRAAARPANH